MPSREEIREHLIELFEQTDFNKETPSQLADAVLWVENEDGVVIRVDRRLPEISIGGAIGKGNAHFVNGFEHIESRYKQAGYVAVKSLV